MADISIYLVRHGETDYNKYNRIQGQGVDEALNERGRRQSEALARYFDPIDLDRVVSSTLKRARETAEIIAAQKELNVETFSDLVEMSYGTMEGSEKTEVESSINKLHKNWNDGMVTLAPDQGESPVEVYRRANKEIMRILQELTSGTILFVLHGRLLRILLSVWLERGLNRMSELPQDNAALNLLYWNGSTFKAEFLNNREPIESIAEKE